MPYRTINLLGEEGVAETFRVRIPDAAVLAWLEERSRLRAQGYPDRPNDVDTPSHRAWIPRQGEQGLPYFAAGALLSGRGETVFPIYGATWYAPGAIVTKVTVTGLGDGSLVSRVSIDHEGGKRPVDKVKVYPPDVDPDAIWHEIETIVRAINEAPMGCEPRDPMVTTYWDFLALDDEVEAAQADARVAGLLAPTWVQ
jgi:hypothetical protein